MAIDIFNEKVKSDQTSTSGINRLTIDFEDVLEFAKEKKCYLLGKENSMFILADQKGRFFRLDIGYDFNSKTVKHDKPSLCLNEISGFIHDKIDSRFEDVLNLIRSESNYAINLRSIFNTDFLDSIQHNGDYVSVLEAQLELSNYNKKNGTNYEVMFQSVTTENQIGFNCLIAKDGDNMIIKAPDENGEFGKWDDFSNYGRRYLVIKDSIQEHLNKFKELNMVELGNDLDNQYMIYVLKSDNVEKHDALKVLGTKSYDYHTAIEQATTFSKEDVILKMKELKEDGVSCFAFDDFDKRFIDLMSTHFDVSEKFVDQWIEQSNVFQSLKRTPTEIVQELTKDYLPVNPLKSIELNLLQHGYLIENREVLNLKIGKEQGLALNLKIKGQDEGVHVSLYRMPSGNYETVAYAVDLKNKNKNQNKPKL